MRGLFITGTAAGVGKTTVGCGVGAWLRRAGLRVAVMKPVAVGCALEHRGGGTVAVEGMPSPMSPTEQQAYARLSELMGAPTIASAASAPLEALEAADARRLARFAGAGETDAVALSPCRFTSDVAPVLAGRLAERPIDVPSLVRRMAALGEEAEMLLVEGVGGVGMPWTDDHLEVDVIAAAALPALVVAPSVVSSLNQLVLTLSLLEAREVPLAGVVLCRRRTTVRPEEASVPLLLEEIGGRDVVLGVLPFLDAETLDDPERLARRCHVHLDMVRLARAAGVNPDGRFT